MKLVAALLCICLVLAACHGNPKGEDVLPKGGVFAFDLGGIQNGAVKFYRYRTGGKDVAFFIARTDTGEVMTAFDACRTCSPYKMGYRQEGGCIVCAKCGMKFKIEDIDRGLGSCVPIRINHRIEGKRLVIDQVDVESGAAWF